MKSRGWLFAVISVVLPFGVFVGHALFFRGWIVDDAGISFAYARNLAEGQGLVAQTGAPPVEGFSNFAWVMLLTPLFLLRLFNPVWTPKLISLLLVLFSFVMLQRSFLMMTKHHLVVSIGALTMLAANTSFVVWTTSGLENPLTALILSSYFFFIVKYSGGDSSRRTVFALGLLAALIALTRPDGLLYFLVFPVFLLACRAVWRMPLKKLYLDAADYLLSFSCLFLSFIVFRWLYFGDLLPNTYYAKGGTSFAYQNSPQFLSVVLKKPWELFNSAVPGTGAILMLALLAAGIYMAWEKILAKNQLALYILMLFSLAVFIILPADWMGEYRFATAFLIFFYSCLFIIGDALVTRINWRNNTAAILLVSLTTIAAAFAMFSFAQRSLQFSRQPTISFNDVAVRYAAMFNKYADQLGIKDGSILLPDLGGMLFYSDLRVDDLAGLCDKTIARTLQKDQISFYSYIFDRLKPSLIFTHSEYTEIARFDMDSRFQRDYVPVFRYGDSQMNQYLNPGRVSGVFIRRELVQDKQDVLTAFAADVQQAINQ